MYTAEILFEDQVTNFNVNNIDNQLDAIITDY